MKLNSNMHRELILTYHGRGMNVDMRHSVRQTYQALEQRGLLTSGHSEVPHCRLFELTEAGVKAVKEWAAN